MYVTSSRDEWEAVLGRLQLVHVYIPREMMIVYGWVQQRLGRCLFIVINPTVQLI